MAFFFFFKAKIIFLFVCLEAPDLGAQGLDYLYLFCRTLLPLCLLLSVSNLSFHVYELNHCGTRMIILFSKIHIATPIEDG